jgi:hypothetical protein
VTYTCGGVPGVAVVVGGGGGGAAVVAVVVVVAARVDGEEDALMREALNGCPPPKMLFAGPRI